MQNEKETAVEQPLGFFLGIIVASLISIPMWMALMVVGYMMLFGG